MYWYGTTQNPDWNIVNGINPEPQSNAWNMNNGGSRVNNNDTADKDMFQESPRLYYVLAELQLSLFNCSCKPHALTYVPITSSLSSP